MNKPDVFQKSYDLWYKKYIEETKKWVSEVNKNPFIAIESHIHEDTITDLLAHILQNDKEIKEQFITFLLLPNSPVFSVLICSRYMTV